MPRPTPALLLVLLVAPAAAATLELKIDQYDPRHTRVPLTRSCNQYVQANPNVRLTPFTPIAVPGGALSGTESTKLMSFAAETAPDLVRVQFQQTVSYVRNRFITDLSKFIGSDQDGDGSIADDEAIWPGWRDVPPRFRSACTIDGRPYAVPVGRTMMGLIYRRDLLRSVMARSRLKRLPRDWEEFYYLCQKATQPRLVIRGSPYNLGRRGLFLEPRARHWTMWCWAAGGNLLEQGRKDPTTGQWHWFAREVTRLIAEDTGLDLSAQPIRWRASFSGQAGQRAMSFYWRLMHAPWIEDPQVDPQTQDHEPINLSEQDVARGTIDLPGGRRVDFEPADVRRGVAASYVQTGEDIADELARGEVIFGLGDPVKLLPWIIRKSGLNADAYGFMPLPPSGDEGSRPILLWECDWYGLNHQLQSNPGKFSGAFDLLTYLSANHTRNRMHQMVEDGIADIAPPSELAAAGYFEYVDRVPAHLADAYRRLDELARTPPIHESWQVVEDGLIGGVVTRALATPSYDWRRGLETAQTQANTSVLADRRAERIDRHRALGWPLFAVFALLVAIVFTVYLRAMGTEYLGRSEPAKTRRAPGRAGLLHRLTPWLFLGPALLLIALWSYYPMAKGSVMSFQDYKIVGPSRWVGIDNFISIVLDVKFYKYLWITAKFALWSLLFGFVAPIALALLLHEVRRGKFILRFVYLLPQVCAGLVITYLWKMFFLPTEEGFINRMIQSFDHFAATAGGNAILKSSIVLACLAGLGACRWIGVATARRLVDQERVDTGSVVDGLCRWAPPVLFAGATAAWWIGAGEELSVAPWWTQPLVIGTQKFYTDPDMALICCVIPGVWAGAGMGSLIYLAALNSVPEEVYEAAEVDGAGIRIKLFNITLAMLKPLIIINFIGAFIGTFHTMGNIFVMTGGGPGDDTTVLALAIWKDAFVYLRFGQATATAWILGAMLIGFTVWQLRYLRRMEFRRAEA
jgi:ABC-type sugar transport system permease subunit